MKKVVVLASFVFSLSVLSGFFSVHPTLAQTCTGSVSCETNCATIFTPPGCKSECSALDPSCRECTGRERVCDTTQVSCGFDNVWNGACAADCSSVGGNLAGGGCAAQPPPTPAPPANRYNCGSGYSCYNAGSGGYYSSMSSCQNNCKPPPSTPPSGTPYPTTIIQPTPTSSTCTECDCPGQPACGGGGCLDEHECGDITVWDCCQGSCVAEGTNCGGGGCTNASEIYQASSVWLRVISNEGPTGTTAWKGTQGNNPIYGPPGANWSGDGLDADGYFQTYQPYKNRPAKTFDKTINKIDSQMNISVTNYPTGEYTYTDSCGDEFTTTVPTGPAHGGAWSNHYCAKGWAWEPDAEGYPAKTKSRNGGTFYTDMSGSSSDMIPDPDPDGCVGLLRQPPDADETVVSIHEGLVSLLKVADPAHWADLQYDGYWTYSFEGWEYYHHTKSIDTVVTLTPPRNYHCQDVRWWGKPANDKPYAEYDLGLTSNADGSCLVRFNTKKYGNMIIMEVAKNPAYERCTIQFEDPINAPGVFTSNLTIDKHTEFKAHVMGESTEPTPPNKERINLWLAKSDFSRLSSVDIPSYFTEIHDANNNRYYYKHDNPTGLNQHCYANGEYPCSMSVTIANPFAQFNVPTLPEGTYNLFCDSTEGSSICSGNVACTMNGGTLSQCYGYNDCEDDTFNPNDHATVTVMCTPQCNNQCSPDPYSDGCGGTCPAGTAWGNPGAVTIGDPFDGGGKSIVTSAPNYSYDVTWGVAESVKTDYFDVVTYPQDAGYADIDAAIAAYQAGATDKVYYKQVTAVTGQSAYTTTVNTLSGQKWKMRLAIRANNITCYVSGSTLAYSNFNLYGSVGGNIQAVTSNVCSGGTTVTYGSYPNVQDGTYVTTSDDNDQIANFSIQTGYKGFGVYGSIVNGQWGVNFLPFDPPMWHTPPVLKSRLHLVNPDLSQAYVCAACNRESLFTCYTGASGATNVSSYNNNFYVQLYNLANEAWWQLSGGNAYGRNGLVSTVPSSCNSGVNCNPIIIGNLSGANTQNSAGIPISNSTISNSGGFYSENDIETTNPNVGNPRGQLTTTHFAPTLENFTYFLVNADVPVPSTATNPGASLLINTPITTRDQFKTAFGSNYREINGETIAWVDNSLTVDLTASTANWNVPTGETWVVFVPGDLTFTGPTTHTEAAQQYLIRVQSGGFLAFISKGDITFNENLGYGFDDDTDMAQFYTPIVEGVFIASDTLVVKSKGGSTPGDYKFVGAGTFVGWTGVNLERNFDNGATRKSLHNNSPTELFIYRPDFMTNAPEFLSKAQMTWKEVN